MGGKWGTKLCGPSAWPFPSRPASGDRPAYPPDEGPSSTEAMDPLALRSSVERQGGLFSIESPSSVHGMRFVVELPLRAVGGDATGQAGEQAAELAGAVGPRLLDIGVMVIDDHADARESLTELMDLEGARTLPFASGATAIEWLERHPVSQWPRVLICDIALGDEDGHAVIRRIRQLEEKRGLALDLRISAVAVTGFAQPVDRVRALMAGFQTHLAKPADPEELISTVQGLAGRHPGASGGQPRSVTAAEGLAHAARRARLLAWAREPAGAAPAAGHFLAGTRK